MTRKSLADLSAAFSGQSSDTPDGWKRWFPFWKAAVDTDTVIRFLPDKDDTNPMGFLVENWTHELSVNGKREKVPCLKMHGEDCPICNQAAKYFNEKSPEHDPVKAKRFYRKRGYIGQVLVVQSTLEHTEGVKLIEFGPAIFKAIQAAFQSGDLEVAPYEYQGGYDFRIKKRKSGEYASYATSSFSPRHSDIPFDIIETIELYNLADQRTPRTTALMLEALLCAEQTGTQAPAEEEEPKVGPAKKSAAELLRARLAH